MEPHVISPPGVLPTDLDLADPLEIVYWSRILGVSEDHPLAGSRVAGPRLEDVKKLLDRFGIGSQTCP